VLSQFLADRTN